MFFTVLELLSFLNPLCLQPCKLKQDFEMGLNFELGIRRGQKQSEIKSLGVYNRPDLSKTTIFIFGGFYNIDFCMIFLLMLWTIKHPQKTDFYIIGLLPSHGWQKHMTLLTSGCAIEKQICEKERLSGCHFIIWDTNFDITTKRVGHSKITISRTFKNFDF